MKTKIAESNLESSALSWLASLSYTIIPGPDRRHRRARRSQSWVTAKGYLL